MLAFYWPWMDMLFMLIILVLLVGWKLMLINLCLVILLKELPTLSKVHSNRNLIILNQSIHQKNKKCKGFLLFLVIKWRLKSNSSGNSINRFSWKIYLMGNRLSRLDWLMKLEGLIQLLIRNFHNSN